MSTRTTPTPTRSTRASGGVPREGEAARDGAGGDALARAIEPVPTERFLAEHWERRPLHLARDEPGRFDDLLSERDVEEAVCTGALRYPGFRLVKASGKLDLRDYTVDLPWRPARFTATADVERVLAEFEAGATIVLQALHLTRPVLAAFCRSLEATLGHPAQANAYYTPRRSQGLPVHHDTHDVFVLQVSGEKRWLVYEPVLPLPLKDQRYSPEIGAPGDPILDLVLRPGDTLYLPRGWLHEALTSETDSLHLTVGVNVRTWIDALKAALAECEGDLEFRRSVPPDGSAGVDLLERLSARLGRDDVARRLRESLVRTRRPIRDGQLRQLRALDRLGLDTVVERRPAVIADPALESRGIVLSFDGKELLFPARAREAIDFALRAERPFAARDLPGPLDDPGRLVLVRRLVREGLLRLTET